MSNVNNLKSEGMLSLCVAVSAQLWPQPVRISQTAGCVRVPRDGPTLTPSGPGSNADVTRSAIERYKAIFRRDLRNVQDFLFHFWFLRFAVLGF